MDIICAKIGCTYPTVTAKNLLTTLKPHQETIVEAAHPSVAIVGSCLLDVWVKEAVFEGAENAVLQPGVVSLTSEMRKRDRLEGSALVTSLECMYGIKYGVTGLSLCRVGRNGNREASAGSRTRDFVVA